ncbi:MAG: polysaccharide deacetylase family protein [Cytophagales bacterium]|nr:polysaccharide deacetylase family protein [Cytophagales bacterium]MDW8385323.1 polysaccharide deacetylase family protein [Flammeovirgaceae bacterium]
MNILHVLSQTTLTGAETYVATLADFQIQQGNRVFIVSDTFITPTKASIVHQPIARRTYLQRVRNILFLRKFIKSNNIDVVHAHSRASSWVSHFAVLKTRVPLISTIHGRQHLHTSTWLYNVYGDRQIAICENIKQHLIYEVKLNPTHISVIPNGFMFSEPLISSFVKSHSPTLSIIGRTNGGKGEKLAQLFIHVLPVLLKEISSLHINIIGGPLQTMPTEGQIAWEKLRQQFSERIHWIGFVRNLSDYVLQSDLVISSGRVAIESLALQVPVFAFGEAEAFGIVTLENYANAKASNFGDILPRKEEKFDFQKVVKNIIRFFQQKQGIPTLELAKQIRNDYRIENVAQQIQTMYESARMQRFYPKHIPVLMYHRIPDVPSSSKNRIFVTKENFEKHLKFFQKRGFTSITFSDYQDFAIGKRPLHEFPKRPIILTFDDGYEDNFQNALPLMQKYGFRGVIFLLGNLFPDYNFWDVALGDERFSLMNQSQREAFVRAGWEIGAHSLSHKRLTQISTKEAYDEIKKSKSLLETSLSISVISFAYPYGDYNSEIRDITKKVGFSFAVATDSGGLHLEDDRFAIFRVNIFPDETIISLLKKTASWYRKYYYWKRKK